MNERSNGKITKFTKGHEIKRNSQMGAETQKFTNKFKNSEKMKQKFRQKKSEQTRVDQTDVQIALGK